MSLDTEIAFIKARWFTPTSGRRIDFIVIHDMEMGERIDTAEDCARFFAGLPSDRKASAHYCVDSNSIVQCVREQDIAYHAPPNTHSLGVEHAGFARQSREEWLDEYGVKMLTLSAKLVAELVLKYNLPLQFLSPEELRAGKRGITTHRNVSKAWGQTSHTDPGPDFPVAWYMDRVREAINEEDPVTEADVAAIATAVANKILEDRAGAFRGRVREALDNELGDESGLGAFSDRVADKVAARLPAGQAVDLDLLAAKVADLLAARLVS